MTAGKRRWIPIIGPVAFVAAAVAWVKRPAKAHQLPVMDGGDSVTYPPAPHEPQAFLMEPPVLRGGILRPKPHEHRGFSRIGPQGPLQDPDPDAGPTGPMGR